MTLLIILVQNEESALSLVSMKTELIYSWTRDTWIPGFWLGGQGQWDLWYACSRSQTPQTPPVTPSVTVLLMAGNWLNWCDKTGLITERVNWVSQKLDLGGWSWRLSTILGYMCLWEPACGMPLRMLTCIVFLLLQDILCL